MYIVVSVEHTNSFDSVPMAVGKFDTLEEAKKFKEMKIEQSMKDFPDEQNDCGFLYTTDERGETDYGYVITIFNTDDIKNIL